MRHLATLVIMLVAAGCTTPEREPSLPPSEPSPASELRSNSPTEIAELTEELESERKRIEHRLEKLHKEQSKEVQDNGIRPPRIVGPKPRSEMRDLSTVCSPHARRPPLFDVETRNGSTIVAQVRETSGHLPCDDLIRKILMKMSWESCETNDVPCSFTYVIAYPYDPIK